MTDRPLTLSQHEARALRAGMQTQFRRVLKPQPSAGVRQSPFVPSGLEDGHGREIVPPYAVDDRLWCRETFAILPKNAYALPKTISPDPDMAAYYRSEYDRSGRVMWRSSTQMPSWASRTTLTVTEVRVQRLQEISCADAIAEGIRPAANSQTIDCDTPDPRAEFRERWDRLHGAGAWAANPWVIACTVTVGLHNIDGGNGNG